ncbi:MAG TPA: hypothetical protein VEH00_10190 [Steroidobacteraceae bacterium]|nr:hypothetical protein [Steroidobacteraceae bacterium]
MRLAALLLPLTCLALAAAARADGWELDLDGRLVSSNADPSYTQGGISGVRFDQDQSGLRLGRARFALTESLGELWSVHLDASAWGDHDRIPVGLTEAYLQFRPYPFAGYRLRVKAGAFYPPISLENRASGWESPYTLSSSAIDSWLAIEVRTVGVEAQLDWLGTRQGHDFDLGVTGGAFGWNEGAGGFIAGDGFTLTDRQTPFGGRVGLPGDPVLMNFEPFREFDGRAGVYGGLELRWLDRVVVRALRYDNRADPTAMDYASYAIAWETTFSAVGARYEGSEGVTAIVQALKGDTTIAPGGFVLDWPFRAQYALLAKSFGKHTLSVRYDRFEVDTNADDGGDGAEIGHAWTAAYVFTPDEHWRFTLEWLHVSSNSYERQDGFGLPPFASETQLQLAVRYALGPAVR